MKLVIIFGPPAVGKMTVGQELENITELKLFHNHMSLELVNHFFDFGTPPFRELDKTIRFDIFKAIASSDLPGLIFTMVWALNEPEDHDYIAEIIHVFAPRDPEVYFIELRADLAVRLKRNKHAHRLAHKASKRNLEQSEKNLLYSEHHYRMHTNAGELIDKNLLIVDNTESTAQETARLIKNKFNL